MSKEVLVLTMHIGECPMCQKKAVELTEHHVVEAPDAKGEFHSINLCQDCHINHERYRNYLRDICYL